MILQFYTTPPIIFGLQQSSIFDASMSFFTGKMHKLCLFKMKHNIYKKHNIFLQKKNAWFVKQLYLQSTIFTKENYTSLAVIICSCMSEFSFICLEYRIDSDIISSRTGILKCVSIIIVRIMLTTRSLKSSNINLPNHL